MTVSKSDFPEVSGEPLDDVDVDLPELPGDWEWGSFNHLSNGKMNVFFGKDVDQPGGWYGEIDNYTTRGPGGEHMELWTMHVHAIEDDGSDKGYVEEEADFNSEHETLAAAISLTPGFIEQMYGGDE
jgi:hypothetical protein